MRITLAVEDGSRQGILHELGVHCTDGIVVIKAEPEQLQTALIAARVQCLSKVEAYFLQSNSDLRKPINVRNEAAAISLLLPLIEGTGDKDVVALRRQLLKHSEAFWPEFISGDASQRRQGQPPPQYPEEEDRGPEAAFESWARSQAITAGIRLASFGGLRGCAAARDLAPGDLMLSIPQDALVYEDTIKETDLGAMLLAIPNITVDNLLIIFTMIDRHDPESKWAPLWASLPQAYYTGLSFPAPLVDALAGTAAQLEIQRAQAHLRSQYAATRPLLDMLLAAYPQHLDPAWFEYQAYLWATELWYSYCFEVEFPGRQGSPSVPVMVPFACHVNHSPWPHVVRYGRVNPATRTLDYPVFRHCSQGQQAFLSYGPVPNLKVLCYYGFVIPNNPHDLVMLKLEPPEGELAAQQQAALDRHGLTLEHNLQVGPFSKQLLGCLRVIVATPEELLQVVEEGAVPQDGALSPENEVQALATLEAALLTLLEPLYSSQLLQGGAPTVGASPAGDGWDTPEAQQVVAGAAAPCQGQQHPREGGRQQEQQQQEAGGQQQEERQRKQEGEEEGDGEEQQALHVTSHAGVVKCSRRNENGMDDAWEASRHFCEVYVRGQVQILEHSLQEVRRLLAVAEVVS